MYKQHHAEQPTAMPPFLETGPFVVSGPAEYAPPPPSAPHKPVIIQVSLSSNRKGRCGQSARCTPFISQKKLLVKSYSLFKILHMPSNIYRA